MIDASRHCWRDFVRAVNLHKVVVHRVKGEGVTGIQPGALRSPLTLRRSLPPVMMVFESKSAHDPTVTPQVSATRLIFLALGKPKMKKLGMVIVRERAKAILLAGVLLLPSTALAECVGYSGPGGPCYTGPGGGLYTGPGGGAYTGPGGGAYTGPGGGAYTGPGGGAYTGPGGGAYTGPGGGAYTGPGGGAYTGPGGGAYAGPGGACYNGPGGRSTDRWNRPSPYCQHH